MLDRKRRIMRQAEMRRDRQKRGSPEQWYSWGYAEGISDAIREFDAYGKADDEW